MAAKPTIALVGCGKMGSALLRGWAAADIAATITVLEPSALPGEFSGNPVIHHVATPERLPPADVLVLAVKPQIMDDVCAMLRPPAGTLVLSIAAGQTIAGFERRFGANAAVIRAMPNTPAAIGRGITVATANASVTAAQRSLADALLRATGMVSWIDDESLMDAVTALSGSGPAYVFYLIEVLTRAGIACGLSAALASDLARQTVIGAAALAGESPDVTAEILRQNVTSPGGTTQAALDVLMNGDLQKLFDTALAAATARSRALSR